MKQLFLAWLLICPALLFSQSNPEPFDLSSGSYTFFEWSASSPAGTYPNNMIFHTTKSRDPKLEDEMNADWTLAYNLTSRSRIIGLEDNGFAFQNTSGVQEDGNYLGAALLSLNASSRKDIRIEWIGRTVAPGDRTYKIVLQYRIGDEGEFITLPSEYIMVFDVGDYKLLPPITLPQECNDKPLVQVRWKYCHVETGMSGTRPALGVDNIVVTSSYYASVENARDDAFQLIGRELQFVSNGERYESVEIFDVLGNSVLSQSLADFQFSRMDLSALQSGVYIAIAKNRNKFISKKLLLN